MSTGVDKTFKDLRISPGVGVKLLASTVLDMFQEDVMPQALGLYVGVVARREIDYQVQENHIFRCTQYMVLPLR